MLTLVFGDWRDALFLAILVANSAIGIAQELRAKRTLDRLAALVAPRATVVRDGEPRERRGRGGRRRRPRAASRPATRSSPTARSTRPTRSRSTSRSSPASRRPVARAAGRRGALRLVRRRGRRALRRGARSATESYAERIAGEAREFRHPRSPLERSLNRPALRARRDGAARDPCSSSRSGSRTVGARRTRSTTAVAGMVTLVPEGLILLASRHLRGGGAPDGPARRARAAAERDRVARLGRHDLPRQDGHADRPPAPARRRPARGRRRSEEQLARRARPLRGLLAGAQPDAGRDRRGRARRTPRPPDESVPFSSRRRWSGLRLGGDALRARRARALPARPSWRSGLPREQAAGRRVVALRDDDGTLPRRRRRRRRSRPLGVAVLAEELRPETRETVAFLVERGRRAEGALRRRARDGRLDRGGRRHRRRRAAARRPRAAVRRRASWPPLARRTSVVGRISPEGKRRVVEALRGSGRYVAMVGDGVNDVPALKAARLAIAQGSGSQMAKGVADVVLVNGDFAVVPAMVAEGRQDPPQRPAGDEALRHQVGLRRLPDPRRSGITPQPSTRCCRATSRSSATLTVGIPAFFLALAPSEGPLAHGRLPAGRRPLRRPRRASPPGSA